MAIPREETVQGTIERVTYYSEETGFAVLRVNAAGMRDTVTVVGTSLSAMAGEFIEAQGCWVIDKKHGQQFKAAQIVTTTPATEQGMTTYLSSGLIKGIGPVYGARMVNTFGIDTFDVIENRPDQLLEVPGIGKKRLEKITRAWDEQKVVRTIMVFLHTHGVGTTRAYRIYKTYGNNAVAAVQENPYRLAHDIHGIGFKTADRIAMSLGIDKGSDIRVRAGIGYVLSELTNDGHCCYPRQQLVARAVDMLEVQDEVVEHAIDLELRNDSLVAEKRGQEEFVYLAPLYHSECLLVKQLLRLTQGKHPCPRIDLNKAISWVEQKEGIKLAALQQQAIETTVASKVMIITGGPGVGKTTLLNSLIRIFRVKKLSVALCAPTGRAAKRLTELTGVHAKTIHRLLEFEPATGGFKHNQASPLKGNLFIMDEASMVDLVLFYQFIRAVPDDAALIVVGDVDQLPSVGPGKVLRDLIASNAVPVVRLTEIFRQAADSRIVTNAHCINQGKWPDLGNSPAQGVTDFYFVEAAEPENIVAKIIMLVTQRIPARFGLDPVLDIQVLTPMNRSLTGTRNLNVELQRVLNPHGQSFERFGWTYRVGDKVMQIENDYNKNVFNGDIGIIKSIDAEDQQLTVSFDDVMITYDFNELDELTLSYAVSIHKAQGSEFPAVVIPIHTQHYPMLRRNLLYTGITRGKKLVVLVGSKKALSIAVRRSDIARRYGLLFERLQDTDYVARVTGNLSKMHSSLQK